MTTKAIGWVYYNISLGSVGNFLAINFNVLQANATIYQIYLQYTTLPTIFSYFFQTSFNITAQELVLPNPTSSIVLMGVFTSIPSHYIVSTAFTTGCPNGCVNGNCQTNGICACNPNYFNPDCSLCNFSFKLLISRVNFLSR